jgi:hypothetical protein
MNLKSKLCILKNYTLLLLGPSPFELWCESCPCFTVRPLSFLLFTTGSSIFLLESPSSPVPLPRTRDSCHRPPPSTCSSAPRSTRRPTPFPTARANLAVLLFPCHVGPLELSRRHASEGVTGAARRLEPNPVAGSPLPLFLDAACCYKANPKPLSPACFPSFFSTATVNTEPPPFCSSPDFAVLDPSRPNPPSPVLPHLLP